MDIDLYILLFYLPDISYIFIFKMLSSIHQSFNVPFFTIQNAHCHWRHQLYVHIKSGLSFVSICHHMRMYIKVWFTCVSTIWSLVWTHATRSDPEKKQGSLFLRKGHFSFQFLYINPNNFGWLTCEDAWYLIDEAVNRSDGNSTFRMLKCFNDFLWEKQLLKSASMIFSGRTNC